jgi:hypothetical protein
VWKGEGGGEVGGGYIALSLSGEMGGEKGTALAEDAAELGESARVLSMLEGGA